MDPSAETGFAIGNPENPDGEVVSLSRFISNVGDHARQQRSSERYALGAQMGTCVGEGGTDVSDWMVWSLRWTDAKVHQDVLYVKPYLLSRVALPTEPLCRRLEGIPV